jgi:hypothetical protein
MDFKEIEEMKNSILNEMFVYNHSGRTLHFKQRKYYTFHFNTRDFSILSDSFSSENIAAAYEKKYNERVKIWPTFVRFETLKRSDNSRFRYLSGPGGILACFLIFPIVPIVLYETCVWLFIKNDFIDPPYRHVEISFTSELEESLE